MKRLLLCVALGAALPVLAQTANTAAKVDPKNNKVSRPVVDKPKAKLMTRDELRSCLQQIDENNQQAEKIKAEQAATSQERSELLTAKEEMVKRAQALNTEAAALKTERDSLLALNESLKTELPKMEKDAAAKAVADYQARAAAMDKRIDAFNTGKTRYDGEGKEFDAKIEAHNKRTESLRQRTDAHLDKVDDWKANCANKPYDEADEAAVRKELGLDKR